MQNPVLTLLVLDISRSRKRDEELLERLRKSGFQVRSMRDPRRAAGAIRRGAVQIAVVRLGRRNAHPPVEVVERLRQASADLPIVAVSPQPSLEESVALLRARATDYIDRQRLDTDLDRSIALQIREKGFALSPEDALRAALGERLRAARDGQRLTLRQLASRAGLSAGMISNIERARAMPSLTTLCKLSRALGVDLQAMFAGF